jgi:hypothetical protein
MEKNKPAQRLPFKAQVFQPRKASEGKMDSSIVP